MGEEIRKHAKVIAYGAPMYHRSAMDCRINHVEVKAFLEEILQCIHITIGYCDVNGRLIEATLLEWKGRLYKDSLHAIPIAVVCICCK